MKPSKYLEAIAGLLRDSTDHTLNAEGKKQLVDTAQVTATLAVSEEQRTANLLAYLPHAGDKYPVLAEIERRLGL